MIEYIVGNLLESPADALVNTVNTVGVMGKGIALQFKTAFPHNYKVYHQAYKDGNLQIGEMTIVEEESLLYGKKTIINFPTKTNWRKPSEYNYIEVGLIKLKEEIIQRGIKSIAIPPLGTGNGGLDWSIVKKQIEGTLGDLDVKIHIYEPNTTIKEALKKERAKLTPARAMLLAVLFELVKNGEFVSEFAAEKVAYFLQRFGAKDIFKLDFKQNFYGPYSGKVRHVLVYLNGSYLNGYSAMDKKPFEELGIMMDAERDIINYLSQPENTPYLAIVEKTKEFLAGFYSSFGLELLSTIDFIAQKNQTKSFEKISLELNNWSSRKRTMFSNPKFVQVALDKLLDFRL